MSANPVVKAAFRLLARLVDANVSQPESRLGLAVDDEWRRRGELK